MSEKLPHQLSSTKKSESGSNFDNSLKDFSLGGSNKVDLNKLSDVYGSEENIDGSITNMESTDNNVSFIYQGYDFHGTKMRWGRVGEESDAWEVEFLRHGGEIDEMTGVGAFKTMRIVLPAIMKIVQMIKEKDSVSPIFFDTDDRRLKLYERAITRIVKESASRKEK